MPSYWMVRCVALVGTEASEECIASIIRGTRIGELGIMLAATSNRSRLLHLLVTANVFPISPILGKLIMEAIRSPKFYSYKSQAA
jgi:hypothetical protein